MLYIRVDPSLQREEFFIRYAVEHAEETTGLVVSRSVVKESPSETPLVKARSKASGSPHLRPKNVPRSRAAENSAHIRTLTATHRVARLLR